MSAESTLLLQTFWSWVCGLLAVGLLGVLLPIVLGLLVGVLPLAIVRRDWRPLAAVATGVPLAVVGGVWALFGVHVGAPRQDFWVGLSVQLGLLVAGGSTVAFLRLSIRRIKEYRVAMRAVLHADTEELVEVDGDFPAPGPRKRLTGIEAEYYIAEWMRHLGATDAIVTPARADGGIDVRSRFYAAQVKHRPMDFVEVETVRALIGAALLENRTPLFFASGHYSRHVYDAAARGGVALFIFKPLEGRLVAANATASRLRQDGLRAPVAMTR
ncbi:restriction endonuclease [Amnibacterium kyonggiense]